MQSRRQHKRQLKAFAKLPESERAAAETEIVKRLGSLVEAVDLHERSLEGFLRRGLGRNVEAEFLTGLFGPRKVGEQDGVLLSSLFRAEGRLFGTRAAIPLNGTTREEFILKFAIRRGRVTENWLRFEQRDRKLVQPLNWTDSDSRPNLPEVGVALMAQLGPPERTEPGFHAFDSFDLDSLRTQATTKAPSFEL